MSRTRIAAVMGVGTLMVAWLASAIGVSPQPRRTPPPRPSAEEARVAGLAGDVQAQAARLRQRLATAPTLQPPKRNPFAFEVRAMPRARASAPEAAPAMPLPEAVPDEPVLVLIGMAEERTPTGLLRTAMITGHGDELHMVVEGQIVAGRYRVVAVGADAVELDDTVTGVRRRLVLK